MMRPVLTFLFAAILSQACFANMASPVHKGTLATSAITSSDIDILKETIFIKPDENFQTALFEIEYAVNMTKEGTQIPLLFHAADYNKGFKIWVDNEEVKLLDFPSGYNRTLDSSFTGFRQWFSQSSNDGQETVTIQWDETTGFVYNLEDLKYFEVNLTAGEHKIRVEYVASVWVDVSNWVNEYSFRYSLLPAKKWKSLGTLEIVLDAENFESELSTNLGDPTKGRIDSVAVWNFQQLPLDLFQIIYVPKVSAVASAAISLGPNGITLLIGIVLALLHFTFIRLHRKFSLSKYSWVVITGSLAIPFLFLIGYMFSHEIIDGIIGKEAGRYHGYVFMVIIFYPLLMPVYWLVMWFIDRRLKRRLNIAR